MREHMLKEAIGRPQERPSGGSLVLRGYELRGHEGPKRGTERGHEGLRAESAVSWADQKRQ